MHSKVASGQIWWSYGAEQALLIIAAGDKLKGVWLSESGQGSGDSICAESKFDGWETRIPADPHSYKYIGNISDFNARLKELV
jgi:hypothetical protein